MDPIRSPRALRNWRNAIVVAFGLGGISTSCWGPRLPAIRADLQIGTGTIGLLVTCGTVGAIGGLVMSRTMLHALGGRRSMMTSLTIAAAALTLMGIGIAGHTDIPVAFGFIGLGAGLGSLDVAINVEGAAVEREAGRTLLPFMHAGWSGGVAAGSGIGALCAAAGIAPDAEFFGLAVVAVAVGFVLTRFVPSELPEEDEPQTLPWGARIRKWLHGWTDRRLLFIGLVLLGCDFGEGSANNWLTLSVKQNHGQSGAVAALFMTLFAISEASSRVLGGPLVDRIGRTNAIRVTTAVGVVGTVLFILGHSEWLIGVGTVGWAMGCSLGFPLGMSAAAEGGDDPAGQVSVVASVAYLSSLGGPSLIGFLAAPLGLLGALWLIAAFLAAAFASAGSLRTPV